MRNNHPVKVGNELIQIIELLYKLKKNMNKK